MIPAYPEPDNFADNVSHSLRKMGHEVVMPARRLDRSPHQVGKIIHEIRRRAFPNAWSEAEKWAVATARTSGIELMLCLTQSMKDGVLEEVNKCGVARCVAWWGDPPANMSGMGLLSGQWSKVYIKDAAAVRKFQAVGLNAHLLHEAMNPDWHCKVSGQTGNSVVVAGAYYGYRQMLVERLADKGVDLALYGFRPPRWGSDTVAAMHRGLYIVKQEKSRIFCEGLACLNSTTLAEGDSLNCRAFEIAGAGGLQLIEAKPAVEQCFEPGTEVLTYCSIQEILDQLARARREPAWAEQIREAGYNRASAHHTYRHRLDVILSNAHDS